MRQSESDPKTYVSHQYHHMLFKTTLMCHCIRLGRTALQQQRSSTSKCAHSYILSYTLLFREVEWPLIEQKETGTVVQTRYIKPCCGSDPIYRAILKRRCVATRRFGCADRELLEGCPCRDTDVFVLATCPSPADPIPIPDHF